MNTDYPQRPHGTERIMYHADGGINVHNLWDPFSADQLIRFVDDFADNGVDIFSQLTFAGGALKPGLFVPEHLQFKWWTNEKFRNLIDSGVQPLQVMVDQAHRRGMKFFCKLRMSDWHKRSVEDSQFVGRHPEFQNPDMIVRPTLDYSHQEVRDYHVQLIDELVRRFDIDGVTLNYIRSWQCFPSQFGGDRHAVMTDFIRQVRRTLDHYSQRKGRKLELAVITLPHRELCRRYGLDVGTWIEQDLIDYLCPGDGGRNDPNLDHAQWADLCRDAPCRYFPMLQMLPEQGAVGVLHVEHLRALAMGMYAGGAEGLALFNWVYYWSLGDRAEVGYPLSLTYMREMRDPRKLDEGARHYRFRPLSGQWSTREGAWKDDFRVVMPRRAGVRCEYPIRLPENLAATGGAYVYLKVMGLSPMTTEAQKRVSRIPSDKFPELSNEGWPDRLEVDVNGAAVPSELIRRSHRPNGRSEKEGRPLDPFTLIWFELRCPPARRGHNAIGLKLLKTEPIPDTEPNTVEWLQKTGTITIEEVDVTVSPPPVER